MHGGQVLEQPDTPLPPPDALGDVRVSIEGSGARRKWLAFAIAGGMLLALAVGIFGGRLSRQSQVDDVAAERDSLTSDVTTLTSERDSLISDVTTLTAERDSLTSEVDRLAAERSELSDDLSDERELAAGLATSNSELRASIEEARLATEALAFMGVNVNTEWFNTWRQAGGDVAIYDDLLAQLGLDSTTEEWAASWDDMYFDGAWIQADRQVWDTGDEALIEAWQRWNEAAGEDSDEAAVLSEVLWTRAIDLVLERLMLIDNITP